MDLRWVSARGSISASLVEPRAVEWLIYYYFVSDDSCIFGLSYILVSCIDGMFLVASSVNNVFYISHFVRLLHCPFYASSISQVLCMFVACCYVCVSSVNSRCFMFRIFRYCWGRREGWSPLSKHSVSFLGCWSKCVAVCQDHLCRAPHWYLGMGRPNAFHAGYHSYWKTFRSSMSRLRANR